MADWLSGNLMPYHSLFQLLGGQAYFVLGMVLARQVWRSSQLPLARSLTWLAGFGVAVASYEWLVHVAEMCGTLPIAEPVTILAVASLGAGYAHLHQFGARSLETVSPRHARLAGQVGTALLIAWIVWVVGPGWSSAAHTQAWSESSVALAGLGLGLPAALLAAYGLRQHARSLVAPLAVPSVWRSLQRGGLALLGFAVLACLVVPEAGFLPAGWPTVSRFELATGLPMPLVRGLVGVALAASMTHAMSVFQTEFDRRLRGLEDQQILLSERERLGRELHDGTLQSIYAAGLLLRAAEPGLPRDGVAIRSVSESLRLLNEAVDDIRGYIGALQPPDQPERLDVALRELASARLLHAIAELELAVDLPESLTLDAARSRHVLAIVNEALSNVARHSRAQRVRLSARLQEGDLRIVLEDDGRGIPEDAEGGHGLRNMCERARILGGSCEIDGLEAGGTRVRLRVPLGEKEGPA